MKWSLPTYALRRPVTVSMVVVAVVTLGAVVWPRLPRQFMLDIDFPVLRCMIPYPGATPAQVEQDIAIPAEGLFRTVPGLTRIRTHSTTNGCWVEMLFDWGTDMSLALSDVRDRMERLRQVLPQDVDQMRISRSGTETQPVLSFTIFSEEKSEELDHWIQEQLKPRLARLEGVAEVEIWGADAGTVYVEFDQDTLRASNLSLYEVITTLRKSNIDLAAGRLHEGNLNHPIRVVSDITSVGELAETIIGPNALRLKNVARVTQAGPSISSRHTIDGRDGVVVRILKNSDANTIETCNAIKAELNDLKTASALAGLDVFTFEDQSRDMLLSIEMLTVAGFNGGGLALIVLFVFVRRIRATLIVAVSVPISMIVGLLTLYFTGMTLNAVTLASMIICLGMLVDNSIVVMENIMRYRERGHDAAESASRGAEEVSLAITTATLTTVVVFFPVFYIQTGELSIYMREFAVPVTVALLASLIVSLTVIPLALGRLTARTREREPSRAHVPSTARLPMGAQTMRQTIGRLGLLHPFRGVARAYTSALAWVLQRRLVVTLALTALIAVTAAVPFQRVGRQTLPQFDFRRVEVNVDFEQTYDWPMAEAVFQGIEQILNRQRAELGIQNVYTRAGSRGGRVRAYLVQPSTSLDTPAPRFSTQQVRRILNEQLPRLIPGGNVRVNVVDADTGGGSTIALRMLGDDGEKLRYYARRFATLMSQIPDVTDVMTDTENETEEIQLLVNETMAAQVGVSPFIIAQTVDFALRGTRLFSFKRSGNEVPVIASFGAEDKQTVNDLENVAVLGNSGVLIPLADLVTRQKADTPHAIVREDGRNVVSIITQVDTKALSRVKEDVEMLIASTHLPPGYVIDEGHHLSQLDVNAADYGTALLLAIILIYIVMGALFESYLLPLSILMSVPMAFVGVYWSMFFAGTPVDIISMIAAILLCGVVVNNGIVLVDHINRLRAPETDSVATVVQACNDRLRPVMMTSLTTILGCLPLAVGSHVADVGLSSVGWTLIGGLSAGTLLTLFVVPLFYSIIDDTREWFVCYFGSIAALFHRPTAG